MIALVTGATRGIGLAIARRLATDGMDVAVGYGRDREAAERVASELPTRAIAVGGDLAQPETARRLVEESERGLGPLDVLVANAGIAPRREWDEIELDEWDRVHHVNLRASFFLAQAAARGMRDRGFGRIVFLSSVAAFTGGVIGAHYASSKSGLHGLTHFLASRLAAHGVTVNAIAPALVESDMIPGDLGAREELRQMVPVGRLGRPEEVAELVASVVANPYLTNQTILVDGGIHPH